MHFTPTQLAYDYAVRSGRISDERLSQMAPQFMTRVVEARKSGEFADNMHRVRDPFDRNGSTTAEIDFALRERYNCSRILFDNLAENWADKTAILCGQRSVSYRALCALTSRMGNGLGAMGLARGGRVLLFMQDTPEYAAAISVRCARASCRC